MSGGRGGSVGRGGGRDMDRDRDNRGAYRGPGNGPGRGGADRGSANTAGSTEPPPLWSIHNGTIARVQEFGCFIRLPGFARDGLAHV